MYIDSYSFGSITVNGQKYTSDLIIYPDKIDTAWWRKEGHRLHREDLKGVMEAKPEILVIGTGKSGVMKVSEQMVDLLNKKGMKVYIEKTPAAVQIYNDNNEQNIIGAFHLTC